MDLTNSFAEKIRTMDFFDAVDRAQDKHPEALLDPDFGIDAVQRTLSPGRLQQIRGIEDWESLVLLPLKRAARPEESGEGGGS